MVMAPTALRRSAQRRTERTLAWHLRARSVCLMRTQLLSSASSASLLWKAEMPSVLYGARSDLGVGLEDGGGVCAGGSAVPSRMAVARGNSRKVYPWRRRWNSMMLSSRSVSSRRETVRVWTPRCSARTPGLTVNGDWSAGASAERRDSVVRALACLRLSRRGFASMGKSWVWPVEIA